MNEFDKRNAKIDDSTTLVHIYYGYQVKGFCKDDLRSIFTPDVKNASSYGALAVEESRGKDIQTLCSALF